MVLSKYRRRCKTSSSSIFNYKTGELTTLGKIYAQIGNPSGYNAKTYGVSSYISTNTSPAACAVAMPTTLYSAKAKKKAFKYQIKAVSKATRIPGTVWCKEEHERLKEQIC
ncbi:MAG: hypothetical protein ACLUNT_00310 [Eubacterium ventriosum]